MYHGSNLKVFSKGPTSESAASVDSVPTFVPDKDLDRPSVPHTDLSPPQSADSAPPTTADDYCGPAAKHQKTGRMFRPIACAARQNMSAALGLTCDKLVYFGRESLLSEP